METSTERLIQTSAGPHSAFALPLDNHALIERTPAALAQSPDPRTTSSYAFLSTRQIILALQDVGFVPFTAAQANSRRTSAQFATHVIRFRRRYETVTLRDCVPEIICLNAHDGRTALQFRLGLYRPICTNGLIVCDSTLPTWRVPHRGHVLEDAITAVIAQSELFAQVGQWVERMERTHLDESQRLAFAGQALALRFPRDNHQRMQPQQLLEARRAEDQGDDLWRV